MRLGRLLTVVLAMGMLAFAQPDTKDTVNVNLRDLNIKDFVEMVGKITHKNILINGDLKGKINFVSTRPIKKSSLLSLATSILASKGYALVDQGDFLEVVKASEASGMGLTVDNKVSGEIMKTVLFPLKHSNAAVIRAKIKPLLHKNAKVVSFKNNNVLSITAYPKTLRSIKLIINSVEGAGQKGSTIIKLKNSSAKNVHANAIKMAAQLFPKTIPSEKVDILMDESTNSIILVGKRSNVNRMIRYIKQLDRKGESVEQKMYVIPLKNSNVEEMEKIMSKLISQMNSMPQTNRKKGAPVQKAMVVSDTERNALIILATGEQMHNIREVIRRIDIEKPQVYIKAKIVEISTNRAKQIGVQYGFQGGKITTKGLFTLAGGTASPLQIGSDLLSFITDSNSSFSFGEGITELFSLGAKIDLLKSNGAAHILSEPSILCTNNKEAEIYVGKTQSILTQAQQSTTGTSNIVNNYSREDIGITLKVKPRLSSHNKVSLTVETEIEDILPGETVSVDRPTTTKRKVVTSAVVTNGKTIILGGLIKGSTGKSVSKVPILGDIPILGELFKSTSTAKDETNVVIYLTPYIVRKSADLEKLKKFLSELEEIQVRYNAAIKKKLNKKYPDANSSIGEQGPAPRNQQDAMKFLRTGI